MRIALVSAAAAAFTVSAAGCSRSPSQDSVYCVDQNRRVVDDRYCDDGYPGGGSRYGYFLWHRAGSYRYGLGSIVAGGNLIRTDDRSGRTRIGVPGSGRVSSGVISRGGIGSSHGGTGS
jgi:hypothetical protein